MQFPPPPPPTYINVNMQTLGQIHHMQLNRKVGVLNLTFKPLAKFLTELDVGTKV